MALPLLDRYVAALPRGIDSYPDVQAKASILRQVLEDARVPRDELPEPLARWFVERPDVTAWVPEVHVNALMLAIYDHEFSSDLDPSRYERWVYERNRALLSTPLYKVLFMVVSPGRLLLGAEKRWSAFRRGTSLHVVERTDESAHIVLRYPPKLQTNLSMRGLAVALRVAMQLAGAKRVDVTAGPLGDRETEFDARWR